MDSLDIVVRLAWLVGAAGFVIGLMRMNSPATARNGNLLSAAGMAIAIGGTAVLLAARGDAGVTAWIIILAGIALGGGLGLYTARTVKMTAPPPTALTSDTSCSIAAIFTVRRVSRPAPPPTRHPTTTITSAVAPSPPSRGTG